MTTPAPDWADDIATLLVYMDEFVGDETNAIATALRAAYERGKNYKPLGIGELDSLTITHMEGYQKGKAEGERIGHIKGLREAADLSYRSPMYTDLSRDNEGLLMPGSPYDHGRYESRKAIRARADELEKESANG